MYHVTLASMDSGNIKSKRLNQEPDQLLFLFEYIKRPALFQERVRVGIGQPTKVRTEVQDRVKAFDHRDGAFELHS